MCKTLVLGLGNPLRADDGAGPSAIKALGDMDIAPLVDLLDGGTAGLETVLLLEGYERTIIVDAADMGLSPGEWRRFTPESAEINMDEGVLSGTLHAAGLGEALALARALDMLPQTVVIYGIQPQNLDWTEGLTEPLKAALPFLCDGIRQDIRDWSQATAN